MPGAVGQAVARAFTIPSNTTDVLAARGIPINEENVWLQAVATRMQRIRRALGWKVCLAFTVIVPVAYAINSLSGEPLPSGNTALNALMWLLLMGAITYAAWEVNRKGLRDFMAHATNDWLPQHGVTRRKFWETFLDKDPRFQLG